MVNSHTIMITSSLAAAIRHIRATGLPHILNALWADAVCINQRDTSGEREHQVQLMGSIYATAALTISWLGPASETSPSTLRFLARFSAAISRERGN
jgi:hypothetical protein